VRWNALDGAAEQVAAGRRIVDEDAIVADASREAVIVEEL
jgi:hypothetical protein